MLAPVLNFTVLHFAAFSRVVGMRNLVAWLASLKSRPRVLVSAYQPVLNDNVRRARTQSAGMTTKPK